jgi:hypothetical protein
MLQLQDFKNFVERAEEIGFGRRQVISVDQGDDNTLFFGISIPKNKPVVVNGRRVVVRKKTKVEEAAAKQIEDHKEAVKTKKVVTGNVAPVKGAVPANRKKKCAVCGWRKGVTSKGLIVSHQSKGKKCPGSDQKPAPTKKVK